MATALQQQLAAIAANSTHQLDLKAQKARHSQSLLFEPQDAASQSFDTIYQICYEGFEELCMLDGRFRQYARSIFSEQSKDEDRTQMTQQENDELDRILDSFLWLVGGRLLLKPAMKAVEWLVRRFRVQEYNTECVLLTFLPYHTSYIFPTLLSILPERLPANFRFLAPYVASLQSPPRHSILSAAVSNPQFLSVFSNYVLRVAKSRYHSAGVLGFWASITAQAVNAALDSSRSGRDSIRQQREEDLLTRLLPILSAALGIKGVPELYLGSCMIMTILVTKASLADRVIDAMMEAIAGAWTDETFQDGLTCLAVMAEEKQETSQSMKVTRALHSKDDTSIALTELASRQRAEKLITATIIGTLEGMSKRSEPNSLDLVMRIFEALRLSNVNTVTVLEKILVVDKEADEDGASGSSHKALNDILGKIIVDPKDMPLLQEAASNTNIDLGSRHSVSVPDTSIQNGESKLIHLQPRSTDEDVQMVDVDMTLILDDLPALPKGRRSFLSSGMGNASSQYIAAFDECAASHAQLERLLALPSLRRDKAMQSPEYFTFLAHVWSASKLPASRAKALEATAQTLISTEDNQNGVDLQALLPYVITGLADINQKVRKAAANLCTSIPKVYGSADIWVAGNVYDPDFDCQLSPDVAFKFLTTAIPLEDCILDSGYIVRSLAQTLGGEGTKTSLKVSALHAICSFLAGHAHYTSALRVKLVLLQIVGSVGKALGDARVKLVLPTVKEWCTLSSENATAICAAENVELRQLDQTVIASVSRRSNDEVKFLQELATGEAEARQEICDLAFDRLKHLIPQMSSPTRARTVDVLLETALNASDRDHLSNRASYAMDVLRAVKLDTETLGHMLETLPKVSDMHEQPPSAKKRRVSRGGTVQSPQIDLQKLQNEIRRITVVLELVEASGPQDHPGLIKALFHLLGELHSYKAAMASELPYVQNVLFSCLHSAVQGIRATKDADFDISTVRTDLIVDSIRTTSSPQIYNSGLLLISSIASWKPDLVLHSVMPLFTFMSSTLLRQSDDYSAHVADQTISSVVPPLAASLRKNGRSIVVGAANLLLSFIAAYEHIPLHRRVTLFERLVTILGPEDTLFAVISTLVAKYSEVDDQVLPFVADLANRFPSMTMLVAARLTLDLLFDALKPRRNLSNLLLGLDENPADVEDTVETLTLGLASLLSNSTLKRRLGMELTGDETSAGKIRSEYALLLEQTMHFDRDLYDNEELRKSCGTLLSAVLGLMPTKDFIESSAQLMQTGSDLTRQQVFDSLESRVEQAKRGDRQAQQVFLEVVPNCCFFIEEKQPVATRHAAITCIDQICVKYGKAERSTVAQAAEQICGPAGLGSGVESLQIVSTLCLASMVEVLGEEIVGLIPKALPQILEFSQNLAADLLDAAFSLLNALLDYIPWILSSNFLDSALSLAARSGPLQTERDESSGRKFSSLAARKAVPAELFMSIERCWPVSESLAEKGELLLVLHQGIKHHTKATITRCSATLFKVMFQAFDLRKAHGKEMQDEGEILDLISTIALDMTLKLNDATFRPFFIRTVEWASTSVRGVEKTTRLLSLFEFSFKLFEQLKSIVTSYSSFLLETSSSVLQAGTSQAASDVTLLNTVLRTLQSSFSHDQDDFWQTPSHFEAIAGPLLGQLKEASVVPADEYAIPTITAFAAAASSPDHLKTINTTIMGFMRHEDHAVRLAAVKCERSITERLNFDWLGLLPEMLPFISELQEDDDENVERETLRWVQQIEDVSGESLEGMLA